MIDPPAGAESSPSAAATPPSACRSRRRHAPPSIAGNDADVSLGPATRARRSTLAARSSTRPRRRPGLPSRCARLSQHAAVVTSRRMRDAGATGKVTL
jgi:hypothetical protein